MKKRIVFIFFLSISINSVKVNAQFLTVESAVNAFAVDTVKLAYGDTLSIFSMVTIQKGGSLILKNYTGWFFKLTEGSYRLDSCYLYYKIKNAAMDSVFQQMNKVFPNGLEQVKYNFCLVDRTSMDCLHDESLGNLYLKGAKRYKIENTLAQLSEPYLLEWVDPLKKKNRYYILIGDSWDNTLDYLWSDDTSITLDLNKYTTLEKDRLELYIVIYSEDGRRSRNTLVKFNSNQK